MSDAAEIERARQARNACHALLPEAVPFVKSLVDAGLIDGWRNVGEARLYTPEEIAEHKRQALETPAVREARRVAKLRAYAEARHQKNLRNK